MPTHVFDGSRPTLRRRALVAVAFALLAAGCGGSHKTTSSTPGSATTPSSTTTSPTGTTSTGSATASSTTTGPATGTTKTHSTSTPPPPSGPRLPATYTIAARERVNPPIVAGPSKVTVALTFVSADHKPHRVLVRTAPPHVLRVPAAGRASVLLAGLPDGSYVLEIDGGAATATLQIGASPGP
jgi:hypothetical protein